MYRRGAFFVIVLLLLFSLCFSAYGVIVDTDKDGLPNKYELENGLDHLRSNENTDSDSDGLLDLEEYSFNSSPVNMDTDNDGYGDKEEFDRGSDPNDSFSPRYETLMKVGITVFLGLMIFLIFFYIIHLVKKPKEKVEKEETPKVEKIKKKSSILSFFSAMSELLLGPSIKKAKERDKLLEKEKIKNIEDVYLDSTQVLKKLDLGEPESNEKEKQEDKQVVFTPENDDFEFQLKKVLRNSKRKNNVSDILSYFDKEMDNEELSLLEEKKSKKEIFEWYQKRKEMKDKIIDLANEEKKQIKEKPIPIEERESSVFDDLDDLNK